MLRMLRYEGVINKRISSNFFYRVVLQSVVDDGPLSDSRDFEDCFDWVDDDSLISGLGNGCGAVKPVLNLETRKIYPNLGQENLCLLHCEKNYAP